MLKASKDIISAAGNSLGLKPNRLAAVFRFPQESKTVSLGREWNEILPIMFNPLNVAEIVALSEGEPSFYTVASNDSGAVLCGISGDVISAVPLTVPDITVDFVTSLGYVPPGAPPVGQNLSYDAQITLLCAADCIKRAKLEALLDPGKTIFAMTPEILAALFAGFSKIMDIRWLSELAAWTCADTSVDFEKGANELVSCGLLTRKGTSLDADGEASFIFGELSKADSAIAINSLFYTNGTLFKQPLMLVHSPKFLWFADLGKNGLFASVELEQALNIVAVALSPGGEVPSVNEPQAPPATQWFCSACGTPNKGMFCKQCGKPQPAAAPQPATPAQPAAGAMRCPACGNTVPAGVKFCKNCGAKM